MAPRHETGERTRPRDTGELMRILKNSKRLTTALETLERDMEAPGFPERLSGYMAERGLSVGQLSEEALLSRSFTYQLCSGERAPSRDMILRLALVLELSVDETQDLLRSAQRGELYPRVERDAVVIFALKERMGVLAADEQLLMRGQETLL